MNKGDHSKEISMMSKKPKRSIRFWIAASQLQRQGWEQIESKAGMETQAPSQA